MSANTIRHKSSNNYDIDDFINQLLASQRFDELAEKVADKAASKIRNIEASQTRLESLTGENRLNKSEDAQVYYRGQTNRDYDKESNLFDNNIKLRNDNLPGKEGKIDTLAVMDESTSQSESLRLKYKYLTRNAYEKKLFNDRASDNVDRNAVSRNNKNEDASIQNVKKSKGEFPEHNSKTESHISSQDDTEKSQRGLIDFDDDNRWRHDSRDDSKESDSNRDKHSYMHSDRDEDRNENKKNKDHSHEDIDSRHEQKRSREVQNSWPEFKSVVNGQADKKGDLENGTTEEETPTSVDEDHTENSVSSAENTQENIQKEPKDSFSTEPSGSAENVEEEPAPQLRAQDETYPNMDENIVASVNDNQEHHRLTDEQNPDNSSKKPIIRREGDKLFTFVEAPEYAEYHEEMAKLMKDKEKSPVDFLVI